VVVATVRFTRMKMLVRLVGWILIAVGLVGGVAGGVLIALGRISGGWLTAVYIVGGAIIVIVIGRALTRVGRRRKESYDDQWTRKGPPKQPGT
jgi:MFS family permease